MTQRVRVEVATHLAEVILARPEKMNALDEAMFEQLAAAGDALRAREDLRCVLLRGEGDNFCSGIDIASLGALAADMDKLRMRLLEPASGEMANFFQRPAIVWQQLDVPVIAVLRGAVFGGGLQIALGADLRFAYPDARLSVMEVKWGLIPDMGITRSLPRLVRSDIAKELLWSGRIVPAAEAQTLGLVTRVDDDALAAARAFANSIARQSPDAIRRGKHLLDQGWNLPAAESLRLEAELQLQILAQPGLREAMAASVAGRKAT
ncbi:MAG: crotonase/enoyl-CoA hydratase family protein [Steroidobacteraceae bacterium]